MTTSLRVSAPADLLATVPYLLGFHPEESVVAVFIRHGRVALTARSDLPAVASAPALADNFAGLVGAHGLSEVVLVAYAADERQARAVLAGMLDRLPVSNALYVDGRRWWSLTCPDACCPADGTPYEVDSHPLAAEAVLAGVSAVPSREAVAAMVQGPPPAAERRLQRQLRALRAEVRRLDARAGARRMEDAVETALRDPDSLSERGCLELALLAGDLRRRDLAWAMVTRADAIRHVALWRRVVSSTPASLAAAPVCLLGAAAWIAGQGALLNCCCERVAELAPGYSLGHLLADLSARAVPPRLWDELAETMRAELGLQPPPVSPSTRLSP